MNPLTCVLTVKEDVDLTYKVFQAEDKQFANSRAEYTLKKEKNLLKITINAADPTALRATITSVTRILNIVQKTKE